jgi:hypothetical protein
LDNQLAIFLHRNLPLVLGFSDPRQRPQLGGSLERKSPQLGDSLELTRPQLGFLRSLNRSQLDHSQVRKHYQPLFNNPLVHSPTYPKQIRVKQNKQSRLHKPQNNPFCLVAPPPQILSKPKLSKILTSQLNLKFFNPQKINFHLPKS